MQLLTVPGTTRLHLSLAMMVSIHCARRKDFANVRVTEVGGYGDHVVPFQAPKGTPGEWIDDPYGLVGETAIGPGKYKSTYRYHV
jgi:hypothetical protein